MNTYAASYTLTLSRLTISILNGYGGTAITCRAHAVVSTWKTGDNKEFIIFKSIVLKYCDLRTLSSISSKTLKSYWRYQQVKVRCCEEVWDLIHSAMQLICTNQLLCLSELEVGWLQLFPGDLETTKCTPSLTCLVHSQSAHQPQTVH